MVKSLREENLEKIITLETKMLRELNTDEPIAENTIPAFRRMRWMTYSVLSDRTVELWKETIENAVLQGRNVLQEKYAMIGGQMPLPDCGEAACCQIFSSPVDKREQLCNNPHIDKIVQIEARWQQTAADAYPNAIQRPKDNIFKKYMVCELYTWSAEAIYSYSEDVDQAVAECRNLAIERYDNLYASIGKGSLAEVEKISRSKD